MRALIVDGYTDEPAGLGVPPYIDVYPRYVAGAIWASAPGAEVKYVTVDFARLHLDYVMEYASKCDLVLFLTGVVVPGKYLGGEPLRLEELIRWSSTIEGPVKVLGGPVARFGYGVSGGRVAVPPERFKAYFDVVASGDVEIVVYNLIKEGLRVEMVDPREKREGYRLVDLFAVKGARIVEQHPNLGWNLIAEIETFRGCPRWITGGCSFCIEPKYGAVEFRSPEAVAREVEALYAYGVRHFRLGRQPDILSFMAEGVNEIEFPSPRPEKLRDLFRGVRSAAPELKMLHIDNVNPGTLAHHKEEGKEALKVIVEYHTPGDVAALGVESADPRVVKVNNLKASPEEALEAVRIINEVGGRRGWNGMPELLPGINFVFGLRGETKETYQRNLDFLNQVMREGLMVRRVNIRQVLALPGTPMWWFGNRVMRKHKRLFRVFKRKVREEFDRPMLRHIVPRGNSLRELYVEAHEGKYSLARQVGSYPILVYVSESLPLKTKLDVVVVNHGYRSVKGIPYPLDVNSASKETLSLVPGIKRSAVNELLTKRPIKSPEMIESIVGPVAAKYLTVSNLAKG
ncbi:MAG: radical SAM protein [Thermofilaceae archaeon]|nr:radical SAM protein [Thermofilaceae archaeon]